MADWLRLTSMIFYAPVRGMREVRDRASLAPIVFIAFLSELTYSLATKFFAGDRFFLSNGPLFTSELFQGAIKLVLIALVLVPLLTLIANIFDRRGSFRVVLTQEYTSVAATMFYVETATNLGALLVAAFFHYSGIQATHVANMMQ